MDTTELKCTCTRMKEIKNVLMLAINIAFISIHILIGTFSLINIPRIYGYYLLLNKIILFPYMTVTAARGCNLYHEIQQH